MVTEFVHEVLFVGILSGPFVDEDSTLVRGYHEVRHLFKQFYVRNEIVISNKVPESTNWLSVLINPFSFELILFSTKEVRDRLIIIIAMV